MTAALVICLSQVAASSGAAGAPTLSAHSRAQGTDVATRVPAPENCPAVRKALRHYTERWQYWAGLRARTSKSAVKRASRCPRYLLRIRRAKAQAARKVYERWFEYHWQWAAWLPDKWQRIGACETGYGRRPGNWRHDASRDTNEDGRADSGYEGAFGFAVSSWDAFKYRAHRRAGPYPEAAWQATPRQQYEVALAIYRTYGFSGWGCANA